MKDKIKELLLSEDLDTRLLGLAYLNSSRVTNRYIFYHVIGVGWGNTQIWTRTYEDVPYRYTITPYDITITIMETGFSRWQSGLLDLYLEDCYEGEN